MIIRRFRITLYKWIEAYLPPLARQPNRLKIHKSSLAPYKQLNEQYIGWRDKETIRSYVTGETDNLVWYLNHLFDPNLKRIYIDTNDALGVEKGIRDLEPAAYMSAGIRGVEPAAFYLYPLKGEHPIIGLKKFAVFIPADIADKENDIKGVVNNYRFAGKSFTIIIA